MERKKVAGTGAAAKCGTGDDAADGTKARGFLVVIPYGRNKKSRIFVAKRFSFSRSTEEQKREGGGLGGASGKGLSNNSTGEVRRLSLLPQRVKDALSRHVPEDQRARLVAGQRPDQAGDEHKQRGGRPSSKLPTRKHADAHRHTGVPSQNRL